VKAGRSGAIRAAPLSFPELQAHTETQRGKERIDSKGFSVALLFPLWPLCDAFLPFVHGAEDAHGWGGS